MPTNEDDNDAKKDEAEFQKLNEEIRKISAEARKAELEARDLEIPYWRRAVFLSSVFQGAALILTLAGALFSLTISRALRDAESAKEDKQRFEAEAKERKDEVSRLQDEIKKRETTLKGLNQSLAEEDQRLRSTKEDAATAGIRVLLRGELTVTDEKLIDEQLSVNDLVVRRLREKEIQTRGLDPTTRPLVRMILLQALYNFSKDPRYKDWILGILLDAPLVELDESTRTLREYFNVPERLEERILRSRFVLHPESRSTIGVVFLNNFKYDPLFRDPFITGLDTYDGSVEVSVNNFGLRGNQIVLFKSFRKAHTFTTGLPKDSPQDLKRLDLPTADAWFNQNAKLVEELTKPGLPILKQCSDDVFRKVIQGYWVDLEELKSVKGIKEIQ